MAQQKDLKRRIRERMAKTGESYTAARAHVLGSGAGPGEPAPASPIRQAPRGDRGPRTSRCVEPSMSRDEAVALGLKCKALATDGIDARRALGRLHDVLASTDDADLERIPRGRAVGPAAEAGAVDASTTHASSSRERVPGSPASGPNGWLLAYIVDGELVLATRVAVARRRADDVAASHPRRRGADELALAAITLR